MKLNNDPDQKIKEVFSNAALRRQNIDIEKIKNMQFKTITAKESFATKIIWLAAVILIIYLTYASTNVSNGNFKKSGAFDISVFEELPMEKPQENKSVRPPDFLFLLSAFLLEGLILFYMIKFIDNIITSILLKFSHDKFKTIHLIC